MEEKKEVKSELYIRMPTEIIQYNLTGGVEEMKELAMESRGLTTVVFPTIHGYTSIPISVLNDNIWSIIEPNLVD